ncbi:hypothetical protein GCM10009831_29600 [Dietzia cercidiphylli]|uniref:SAF domain-containing protein n=1 Tax=Dietzia cercidiphylli TaxID=498199 RepID=A0ABN2J4L5_9ACTN
MNRRVVAVAVAVLLALLGAALLLRYVSAADERAMADLQPVSVLIATAPISEGTPASALGELVETRELPATAVGPNSVTDLRELGNMVAATDLAAGEQLLAGRFASLQSLQQFGGIPAPEGFHQVTVPLNSPGVVGGTVTPGDTVGVFISMDTAETHLVLHKVLVLRVQGGLSPSASEEADSTDPADAPIHDGGVMVTLALTAPDAEKVVFGAEHGSIWLSLEDAATPEDGTRIVNPGNVYR